jgi:hypothetical protein
MKVRMLVVAATLAMLWSVASIAATPDGNDSTVKAPAAATATEKPGALLPELKFEFDPVVDGTQITHDFPVKNTGDGPMEITKVKTG